MMGSRDLYTFPNKSAKEAVWADRDGGISNRSGSEINSTTC